MFETELNKNREGMLLAQVYLLCLGIVMRTKLLVLCLGIVSAAMPTLDKLTVDRVQFMEPRLDASGNTQSTPTGCADGTAYNFLVRKGTTNVNRVLIDFMGGGACWGERCLQAESKQVQTGIGLWSLLADRISADIPALYRTVIGDETAHIPIAFSTDVAEVKTWTYMFVPYCTQDINMGSCNTTYVNSKTGERALVRHNGAANVKSVMDWVYNNFPQPDSLAFIGCSAGASVIPFMAARASTHYGKSTTIIAVADSPFALVTEKFARQGMVNW